MVMVALVNLFLLPNERDKLPRFSRSFQGLHRRFFFTLIFFSSFFPPRYAMESFRYEIVTRTPKCPIYILFFLFAKSHERQLKRGNSSFIWRYKRKNLCLSINPLESTCAGCPVKRCWTWNFRFNHNPGCSYKKAGKQLILGLCPGILRFLGA